MSTTNGDTPIPSEAPITGSESNSSNVPVTPPLVSAERPCPHCGGMIRTEAVTCRHCTRDLYDPNAPQLVLDPNSWVTEVPQWMRDVERKALAQRLLIRKLRRNSWKIVGYVVAPVLLVILWRLATMPKETFAPVPKTPRRPSAQVSLASAVKPTPFPTPYPSPTPGPQSTSSPSPSPTPLPEEPAERPLTSAAQVADEGSVRMGRVNPPAYDVTATDIAREYRELRAIADDKYNSQIIRISGAVQSIDTTGNTPAVILATGKRPFIKCLFATKDRAYLNQIKPGTTVSVRGTCEGAFIDVMVSDCSIE